MSDSGFIFFLMLNLIITFVVHTAIARICSCLQIVFNTTKIEAMGASGIEFDESSITREEYYLTQAKLDNTPTIDAPTVEQPVVEDDLYPVSKGWQEKALCLGANLDLFMSDIRTDETDAEAIAVWIIARSKKTALTMDLRLNQSQ